MSPSNWLRICWLPADEVRSGDRLPRLCRGDEVFCSKVESEADDYRYGSRQGATVSVEPAALAEPWAERCRALAAAMGFSWPASICGSLLTAPGTASKSISPAFTYYDRQNQGIAQAVARLLAEPRRPEGLGQAG